MCWLVRLNFSTGIQHSKQTSHSQISLLIEIHWPINKQTNKQKLHYKKYSNTVLYTFPSSQKWPCCFSTEGILPADRKLWCVGKGTEAVIHTVNTLQGTLFLGCLHWLEHHDVGNVVHLHKETSSPQSLWSGWWWWWWWWWSRTSCPQMSANILGTNCDQCVSMVQCCFTSTETIRLIRTGSPGQPPRLSHSSWTVWPGFQRWGLWDWPWCH